jgi:hypothetical protein
MGSINGQNNHVLINKNQMNHPIYHVKVLARNCRVDLSLNSFPLGSIQAPDFNPVTDAPPVNPYLAGTRNELKVTILPASDPGGLNTKFDSAEVQIKVCRFEMGQIVSTENDGQPVAQFSITNELRKQVRDAHLEFPNPIIIKFSNEAIDFSTELLDALPYDNMDALRDYAVYLGGLANARNTNALLAEFEPKMHVWSVSYAKPYQEFMESLKTGLEQFTGNSPVTKFEREDIELQAVCGGRIWNITRKGKPLLEVFDANLNGTQSFNIYVAPRNGVLRIVR